MRRMRTAAILALLVGVLAGCGGSSPADDFRDRANAVCKDGNEAIDELAVDFGKEGPTHEQLEEVAPKVPPLLTKELDRLDALEPPKELADKVDAMLASFRAVVRTMEQQGTAFFERKDAPFAESYAKADALGLDECAH